ncbi:hypothetical protein ABT120_58145 [Nonomuraea angiospora]|uniref:hypothetical protein n=1 Tax=Nonomuraea angiospora TaxID=46172 RepID=UPI00331E06FA
MKKAKLSGVRGKGRTSRSVFLGLDARTAPAECLEHERGLDLTPEAAAPFLAASSIAVRRPGGRLSPRSINTIVAKIGAIHDLHARSIRPAPANGRAAARPVVRAAHAGTSAGIRRTPPDAELCGICVQWSSRIRSVRR